MSKKEQKRYEGITIPRKINRGAAAKIAEICIARKVIGKGCNGCVYNDEICNKLKEMYNVDKAYLLYDYYFNKKI